MGLARQTLMLAPVLLGATHFTPVLANCDAGRRVFPAIARVPAPGAVGLTFDDGPDRSLDAFLTALEQAGARATFFVTGEQVERDPSRVADLIAASHEVGVHGYRHRLHLRLTPWQVADDLRRGRAIIEDATGRSTTCFRPPHGLFSTTSWREAERQGWTRVLWSRAGNDWQGRATPRSIADRIGTPAAGEILLLHDSDRYSAPGSWRNTLGALPLIFERLDAAGLAARPFSELLSTASCS